MNTTKAIQIPAILTGFATKVDGGASVRFATNELSDTDVLELKRNQGAFGWLLFAQNQFTTNDIPTEQAEDKNKTPSKRLRNIIFLLWKQLGANGDFEAFYRECMEKLINQIKGTLD